MPNDAIFSEDGRYRYILRRMDLGGSGLCVFIMLNPSTADAENDDPTIGRCISFAKAWGYNQLVVGNLFAYRATNPKEMRAVHDPVGPDNDVFLKGMVMCADLVVCAWGNEALGRKRWGWRHRSTEIEGVLKSMRYAPHHLGLTKLGMPRHPLYLLETETPQLWR